MGESTERLGTKLGITREEQEEFSAAGLCGGGGQGEALILRVPAPAV